MMKNTTTQWNKGQIIFEVPGKVRGKGRPRFMRNGHTYTDKNTVEYEKAIKSAYLRLSRHVSTKSIRISLYVFFAPNKSDTKRNREVKLRNAKAPKKKPDIDNVIKVVLDALNKVAYEDDTQVNEVHVERLFSKEEKLIVCLTECGELFGQSEQKAKKC